MNIRISSLAVLLALGGVAGCGSSDENSGSNGTGGSAGSSGNAGNAGNGASAGTGGTPSGGNGGSGAGAPQDCSQPPTPGLPADAPALEVGKWVDITPAGLPVTGPEHTAQGMAIDRCNPATLYFCVVREGGGVYKSTNAGGTWTKLGGDNPDVEWDDDGKVTALTFPIHLRVDPADSLHLFAGDGVEGSTNGWWRSFDGGLSWEKPETFAAAGEAGGVYAHDVYDVAVDPSDFSHVLVSSHSDPYVMESKDGGDTWTYHAAPPNVGTGHSIDFLYNPALGLGDSNTWLLGTQGGGYWRTENGGESWENVSDHGIVHGGGDLYYAHTGDVYATAEDDLLKSTDNGKSWQPVGIGFDTSAIHGDGTLLYTNRGYMDGPEPFYTSAETDGLTWGPQSGGQPLTEGAFEMAFDATNRILYASSWGQHFWALKVE